MENFGILQTDFSGDGLMIYLTSSSYNFENKHYIHKCMHAEVCVHSTL